MVSSRSDRSLSVTSSSPRKYNRQAERLDRYGMKKRKFISSRRLSGDDDGFAARHHNDKFSRHGYGMKYKSSNSKRRARCSASDFEDCNHERSPLKRGYRMKCKSSNSKRRARCSASDFEDCNHERSPLKTSRYRSRAGAYFSKRRNSPESDDYRCHRRRVSKNLHYQSRRACDSRRRRSTSSSDSGDSRHRRRLPSVIQKPKFEDVPDVGIVKEERLKNNCWRSKEKEPPAGYSLSKGKEPPAGYSLSKGKEPPAGYSLSKEKEPPAGCSLSKEKESSSMYRLSNVKEPFAMYRFYLKSGKYMEEGNLKKALKSIDIAITKCKDDDKFLSKSYCRRGDIYSLLDKPRCSFQGFLDWEHAYIINNDNMEARKRMSKVIFMGANNYYRMKAHEKALTLCNHALDLNERNGEAFILQQLLKKKLLDKMKKKSGLSAKNSRASKFGTQSIPEKISNALPASCSYNEEVYNEIERFPELIKKALVMDNLPRALILVKQASMKLHETSDDDDIDDEVFRKLYVLKQNISMPEKECLKFFDRKFTAEFKSAFKYQFQASWLYWQSYRLQGLFLHFSRMTSVNPDLKAVKEDEIKSALALLS